MMQRRAPDREIPGERNDGPVMDAATGQVRQAVPPTRRASATSSSTSRVPRANNIHQCYAESSARDWMRARSYVSLSVPMSTGSRLLQVSMADRNAA
jgi:hypothetical protein